MRAKIAPNRLIAEFNISGYGVARNPIAANVKFGDDCDNARKGLSQWTAALTALISRTREGGSAWPRTHMLRARTR